MDPTRLAGPVASAFGLLELLVASGGTLPLAEIARRSGRPRSSAHRTLASLAQLGYVQQEHAGMPGDTGALKYFKEKGIKVE